LGYQRQLAFFQTCNSTSSQDLVTLNYLTAITKTQTKFDKESYRGAALLVPCSLSIQMYQQLCHGATFIHPILGTSMKTHALQFIDNTTQFLNYELEPDNIHPKPLDLSEELLNKASYNAQSWSNLLWISGGDLNFGKCFSIPSPYLSILNVIALTIKTSIPTNLCRSMAEIPNTPLLLFPLLVHATLLESF
jgi:hypothetical protein